MKKLLVALAAVVLALMAGQYGAQEAHAQTVDLSIGVVGDPCETGTGDTDCDVTVGTMFTVKVNLNSFTSPTGDYMAIQARLQESAGLTYQDRGPSVGECVWPDSDFGVENEAGLPGDYLVGCNMIVPPWSTYTGAVIEVDYTCPASPSAESVTLVHGPPNDTYIVDSNGSPITEAGTETLTINCIPPPVDFSIEVATAGCDTDGGPTTCNVPVGSQFTVGLILESFSDLPDSDGDGVGGYLAFEGRLNNSGAIPYQDRPGTGEIDTYWPSCVFQVETTANPNSYLGGCAYGIGAHGSTYTGKVMEVDYNCTASPSTGNTVTLVNGEPNDTYIVDENGSDWADAVGTETLTINCTEAPTPTPTPPPGVGGEVELRTGASDLPPSAAGSATDTPAAYYIAVAVAGAILVLAASGWYARRRWLR